jgi:thioredoxin reductase
VEKRAVVHEPAREVPVRAEVDVLVAGGGPGGVASAVAAARAGASVLLVEQYGCVGGMGTIGHVLTWSGSVAGGLFAELKERMKAADGITANGVG